MTREVYGAWAGRRVALWHGDTPASQRRSILTDPPDLPLTTPESLKSMLVGASVDHGRLFAGLRAVVVDAVHAFAGGDRGWHLLAVLERLSRIAGRPLQRIGLSATVGNPGELLAWLQGPAAGKRPATVVAPSAEVTGTAGSGTRSDSEKTAATGSAAADADIQLDYVGSVANAAKVIAALHQGRDCVVVSTSALELGIDVGDLDRLIQVNAPLTVAAFLQRLGRGGRRAETTRNCLFLALREDDLLLAAGLLLAWSRGFVEPVAAPPEPMHITAQQLLALCLQEGRVGEHTWPEWLALPALTGAAQPITGYLVERGYLRNRDTGRVVAAAVLVIDR